MTREEFKAMLAAIHKQVKDIPKHAIEVWEDGEITMTKCSGGELYGQRNLHCMENGFAHSLPRDLFPEHTNSHSFVRTDSYEEGKQIRETIRSLLT